MLYKKLVAFILFLSIFMILISKMLATSLPVSAVNAGWERMELSDKTYYQRALMRWAGESNYFSGKIAISDYQGNTLNIARANGVNRFEPKDNLNYLSSNSKLRGLNSIYTKPINKILEDKIPNVIICGKACLNITAWFYLGDILPSIGVATSYQQVDSVMLGKVINEIRFDPFFLESLAKDVDYPNITKVYEGDKVLSYNEKDRVFVKGSRDTGLGSEDCVGYFDYAEEINKNSEFTWFCYNNTFKLFTGDSKETQLKNVEYDQDYQIGIPVNKDILSNLNPSQKSIIHSASGMNKNWVDYHTS